MADEQAPPQEGETFYDDGWTEEDEERYQARRHQETARTRRRRRQGTSFAVLVLLVLGIGLGAAGIFNGWWEWPFDDEPAATTAEGGGQPCPPPVVTAAPVDQVTVRVLNATDTRGLAATIAAELQARGMTVTEIGNDEAEVAETAQVRHGPESVLQARTVAAQFPGVVVVDDARPGTDVELSVGTAFTVMVPREEATAALVPAPAESPAGCVTPAPPAPVDPGVPATTPAP